MKIFLIFLFLIFNSNVTFGTTFKNLTASFQYGITDTFEIACRGAKENFFDKARRKALGSETISAESIKICKKNVDENNCTLFTNSFRSIASIAITDYEFFKFPDGTDCKESSLGEKIWEATVKGNISLEKLPEPNTNFDFKLNLNKFEFTSYPLNKNKKKLNTNEKLQINIQTLEDMYIYAFQWLPYEDKDSIHLIFPNEFDKNNLFEPNKSHFIPSNRRLTDYNLRVHFPDESNIYSSVIQEFLMLIATKNKINFFQTYNYADFGRKLTEIESFRQHRKSYIIRKRVD